LIDNCKAESQADSGGSIMYDPVPIMLVEDDAVDAAAATRALKELKINGSLIHLTNGQEALAYLQDDNNIKPALIVADIHMPHMTGLEFLHAVKQDPNLQELPVIVLSSSEKSEDKDLAFSYGAAGYIVKPVSYEQLLEALKSFKDYWSPNELPSADQQPESAGV